MSGRGVGESRLGVELTNLDGPLADGTGVTKRDLVDYLQAVAGRLLPHLRDRPLSVVRARPGSAPFMQKNLPAHAPEWIARSSVWAEASQRMVAYPLCQDERTLLWLANQRAVEYHPAIGADPDGRVDALVIDLDPPPDALFAAVVAAARLVERALADAGLSASVKTSGAKGLHVVVPLSGAGAIEAACATRALAARAAALDPQVATTAYLLADRGGRVFLDPTRVAGTTLVAAYSPRVRPGLPVSFPVGWEDLDRVAPGDFTVRTVPGLLGESGGRDPWRTRLPAAQPLPADLVAQGREIPVPRVAAMHEGRRRRAAARRAAAPGET